MLYLNPIRDIVHFVKDIYWCNIPLNCRRCLFLNQCRADRKHKRKCYHGCLKVNIIENMKKYKTMTTEELDALLRVEQEKDGVPDVGKIKAILQELDARGKNPPVDVDKAWNDFRENYLDGLVDYVENEESKRRR